MDYLVVSHSVPGAVEGARSGLSRSVRVEPKIRKLEYFFWERMFFEMRRRQLAIEKRHDSRRRHGCFVIGEIEIRNSRMRFSAGKFFEQRVVVGKKTDAPFRLRIENGFGQIEGESGIAEVIDGGNEEIDVGRRIGHGDGAFTFQRSRVYLAMSICKNPSPSRTMAKPLPSAFLDRLSAFLSEPDFRSVLS